MLHWKNHEKLIKATGNNTDDIYINRITITKKENWEKKTTTVWIFQAKNWQNLPQKDLDMVMEKDNFKREIESLQIAAQNNPNYVKVKANKSQQNRKYTLSCE